jgi:predicted transcriptional regulator
MDKREWELVISKVQALKHTTDTAETIYEEANLELINTLLQLAREALPYYIDELIKARVELAAQGKLWESVKDTLVTRIDHLEKERDKTHAEEAVCWQMLQDIVKCLESCHPMNEDEPCHIFETWIEAQKLLASSTADQDLLDRLEKLARAEQREKQLVKALEFYADINTYRQGKHEADLGEIARSVLKNERSPFVSAEMNKRLFQTTKEGAE